MLRNAGNAVPVHSAGGNEVKTIEFALTTLGVQHIVVCGHYGCGAVADVRSHVFAQVEHLRTYPVVQEALAAGKVSISVWLYRIETGEVSAYNAEISQFELI